jgi:hypothetical protein
MSFNNSEWVSAYHHNWNVDKNNLDYIVSNEKIDFSKNKNQQVKKSRIYIGIILGVLPALLFFLVASYIKKIRS